MRERGEQVLVCTHEDGCSILLFSRACPWHRSTRGGERGPRSRARAPIFFICRHCLYPRTSSLSYGACSDCLGFVLFFFVGLFIGIRGESQRRFMHVYSFANLCRTWAFFFPFFFYFFFSFFFSKTVHFSLRNDATFVVQCRSPSSRDGRGAAKHTKGVDAFFSWATARFSLVTRQPASALRGA